MSLNCFLLRYLREFNHFKNYFKKKEKFVEQLFVDKEKNSFLEREEI